MLIHKSRLYVSCLSLQRWLPMHYVGLIVWPPFQVYVQLKGQFLPYLHGFRTYIQPFTYSTQLGKVITNYLFICTSCMWVRKWLIRPQSKIYVMGFETIKPTTTFVKGCFLSDFSAILKPVTVTLFHDSQNHLDTVQCQLFFLLKLLEDQACSQYLPCDLCSIAGSHMVWCRA